METSMIINSLYLQFQFDIFVQYCLKIHITKEKYN
jgi:hypothetical protein